MEEQEPYQPTVRAPAWHTAALIALICVVAISGTLLSRAAPPTAPAPIGRIPGYLTMGIVPLVLTFYVARVGRGRNALPALLGERFRGWGRLPVDLGVAILCVVAIVGLERASSAWFPGEAHAASALLPTTPIERAVWIVVAACVGFGEEVVYRGYLRGQLASFSGRAWVGIVGQAALFGIAHLDQGAAPALRIAVYGLVFALVVTSRRSLLPAIYAHVAIDAASAFAR